MYLPASFAEDDRALMQQWIVAHPLGLLITHGESGLQVSPLPFAYREQEGRACLITHMARANPQADDLKATQTCWVVFQGEQNYVTPSWYPSKQTTHKVVPTWNYALVQVRGTPHVRDDAEWLAQQVSLMTQRMEQARPQPWQVQDAPEPFIATQLKAIVGLEIDILEMQGKWKMSQNRSLEDAQGVVEGLSNPHDPHANPAVAQAVAERLRQKK